MEMHNKMHQAGLCNAKAFGHECHSKYNKEKFLKGFADEIKRELFEDAVKVHPTP
jgi:hypothetical protein